MMAIHACVQSVPLGFLVRVAIHSIFCASIRILNEIFSCSRLYAAPYACGAIPAVEWDRERPPGGLNRHLAQVLHVLQRDDAHARDQVHPVRFAGHVIVCGRAAEAGQTIIAKAPVAPRCVVPHSAANAMSSPRCLLHNVNVRPPAYNGDTHLGLKVLTPGSLDTRPLIQGAAVAAGLMQGVGRGIHYSCAQE